MTCAIDHLVVAAHSLAQGVAWCQATLGATPGPGGRHAVMGTHNRLLAIASPAFPQAYLEILAIDRDAPAPGRPRWFGLDDAVLQAQLQDAPRLLHAVLRTDTIEAQRLALVALGLDPGALLAVERDTPDGLLSWRILVRADGQIACAGALPTLIQWQGRHPAAGMALSPVALRKVALGRLSAPVAGVLRLQGAAVNTNTGTGTSTGISTRTTGPVLAVTLDTPLGAVALCCA